MLAYIDPLYWVMMIPVIILSAIASMRVKSTFKKFSKYATRSGMSGAEVARRILDHNGLGNVSVEQANGFLSDHYDPSKKVVRLSPEVYSGSSISSLGVAAHETGHAIQHAKSYAPLMLRNMMVPIASIGSNLSWVIIMVGMFMGAIGLVKIGIIFFTAVVAFQIITLPVEFDASSRAKKILSEMAYVTGEESRGISKVLNAAAMTYVAAAVSAIMTLLYFLMRAGLLGGSDD